MDCIPPGSSVKGDSPGKDTGVGCHALLQGGLPYPGIEARSPALQVDSLPSEAPGKPTTKGPFSSHRICGATALPGITDSGGRSPLLVYGDVGFFGEEILSLHKI